MIGVFDSGLGGLTILQAITERMPQYDYVYLADTVHAPYGSRGADEISELTWRGVTELFKRDCQLVILGCNTASTVLRQLQTEYLPQAHADKRLLGIIVPTVEQISGAPWYHETPITTALVHQGHSVGVLATPATVASEVFVREVNKRNASIRVVQQACPELVHLIESGVDTPQLQQAVAEYVGQLMAQTVDQPLEAVLLGCTHYELLADVISQALPATTRLYHQPSIVAASLANYLERHDDLAVRLGRNSGRVLLTTGDPAAVRQQANRFFPEMDSQAVFTQVSF